MRHSRGEPFEVDVREATQTAQIFCAARIASGEAVSAETVKHYFHLAEQIQIEGEALYQRVEKAREAAQAKRDGVKP